MPRILRQTTVVRDGFHNAFTDLQYWQASYWVACRKASCHNAATAQVAISVSEDRQRFRDAATLHTPGGGDIRDPKLFPVSENRIALFTMYCEMDRLKQIPYAQKWCSQVRFSDNGYDWEPPIKILEQGQKLWRVREHEGVYYALAYECCEDGNPEPPYSHRLLLFKSGNLIDWVPVSQIGPDEYNFNESDIVWDENGAATVLARSETRGCGSFLCRSVPPYRDWECTDLGAIIHAPIFLRHELTLYVAGRSFPYSEGKDTHPFTHPANLSMWIVGDRGVEPVMRIPAAGDCAYPGLIRDPDGRICMTYYSQHAYYGGVVPWPTRQHAEMPYETADCLSAADIYFAELLLP